MMTSLPILRGWRCGYESVEAKMQRSKLRRSSSKTQIAAIASEVCMITFLVSSTERGQNGGSTLQAWLSSFASRVLSNSYQSSFELFVYWKLHCTFTLRVNRFVWLKIFSLTCSIYLQIRPKKRSRLTLLSFKRWREASVSDRIAITCVLKCKEMDRRSTSSQSC